MRLVHDAESTQAGIDARVARLAASQHGVFARAHVTQLGATRGIVHHRVRTGRWERISSDVFRIAGSPRSWVQDLMAGCLVWGAAAIVSHRAAAALWRLVGFEPGIVELTVPRSRRRAGPGIIHRYPLFPGDVTTAEGIPTTTPARTLIDLAAVAPREAVEEALDDALRRRIVTLPGLRHRLTVIARPGRPGIAAIRLLLDARDLRAAVPESVFERRLLRQLQRAGLPPPVPQHEIRDRGRLVAIVDFAYPDARLAIEADGYRWHSGRARWDHDRARRNRLTVLGWKIIHVTWPDLNRPAPIIRTISDALVARG